MTGPRADPAPAPADRPRVRALVVDDEPSLVTVVAGYLAREGYAVDTAADGEPPSRPPAAVGPTWWCWT